MTRFINPSTVAPPLGTYTHAVEVAAGARWLHIAGQVGIAPDGGVAEAFAAQAHQAWKNLIAILHEADMDVGDLVHVNHWLTNQDDFPTYAEVRAQYLGAARPAATLMIVKDLVKPGLMIEVGGVAAKMNEG
ncbi:MAG: RidA family protein [Alphaproteobacteria bacterium]|jgi:enamine deaminase RidA (YjgF/YER057c/UK114 family)|nr:RidA family protein [Alphaproteobacteria bacterium]|tara:strand:+ start:363 stop:758 length:396 start_codon:yes stop_codon:yes gene_type:complete